MQLETFLDVLLIEEIPFDESAQESGIVGMDGRKIIARTQKSLKFPPNGRVVACDVRFPMNGLWVDMPYKPGDIVRCNEFGRDPIMLNPEDEGKSDAKKHFLIHYQDIQGRVRA